MFPRFLFAVFAVAVFLSPVSVRAQAAQTLDEAVRQGVLHLQNSLGRGRRVQLVAVQSENREIGELVQRRLSERLVNNGWFVVVERDGEALAAIEREMTRHLYMYVCEETELAIGRQLGAEFQITGRMTRLGQNWELYVFAVNVETAQRTTQRTVGNIRPDPSWSGLIPPPTAAQPGAQPPAPPIFGRPPNRGQPPAAGQNPSSPAAQNPPPGFVRGGFVRVEGGVFRPEGSDRYVTVGGFDMAAHPVTQGEWFEIMGTNPGRFRGENLPVETVSWFDAVEFANRKSLRAGLTPAYAIVGSGAGRTVTWNRNANGYRLPTEAEWEFAARGGIVCRGNFAFPGSDFADDVAWHSRNSGGSTRRVGTLRPNALGLYDMSGNVWEWVWDPDGGRANADRTGPAGASAGSFRVVRGGGWNGPLFAGNPAPRDRHLPSTARSDVGFRLVRP